MCQELKKSPLKNCVNFSELIKLLIKAYLVKGRGTPLRWRDSKNYKYEIMKLAFGLDKIAQNGGRNFPAAVFNIFIEKSVTIWYNNRKLFSRYIYEYSYTKNV